MIDYQTQPLAMSNHYPMMNNWLEYGAHWLPKIVPTNIIFFVRWKSFCILPICMYDNMYTTILVIVDNQSDYLYLLILFKISYSK